jgi:hypothetical protein
MHETTNLKYTNNTLLYDAYSTWRYYLEGIFTNVTSRADSVHFVTTQQEIKYSSSNWSWQLDVHESVHRDTIVKITNKMYCID